MTTLTRRTFLTGATALSGIGAFDVHAATSARRDDFISYDAIGLAELVRARQVTARELTEHFIRRIEVMDPVVTCVATPTFERALDRADGISPDTLFAGVPTLMKDMLDIGGVRRTDGSRLLANNVPVANVAYTDALETAGLNIVATTKVPEFANGLSSDLYGAPRNPWDLNYSCAASSSGAACAVASGMASLVHGTDGGGSNRLPPSFTHLFGYKPTRGRMMSGEVDGSHDVFKSNGPISRTVRDAEALFRACEDPQNAFGRMNPVRGPAKQRLKIAYARNGTSREQMPDRGVVAHQDGVATLLREMGHEVVEIVHPVNAEDYNQSFRWAFLPKFTPLLKMVEQISGQRAEHAGLLNPWTVSSMRSAEGYTDAQIEKGLAYFQQVAGLFQGVFNEFDMIFSTTSPLEPQKLDWIRTTDDFAHKGDDLEFLLSITSPINAVGDCAMTVPLGFSGVSGMPVGSMFHAQAGADSTLFALAYELQEARHWDRDWAPYSLKFIPL